MAPSQPPEASSFASHIGRSVSLDHAARLLGVSRRTIYNRIRENRLQTIRTAGGSQRVLIDSLTASSGRLNDFKWRPYEQGAATDYLGRRLVDSNATVNTLSTKEQQMNVKTQIKAGFGDDSIWWGN